MIWELFESNFHHACDDVAIIRASTCFSWQDIHEEAKNNYENLSNLSGKRVGLIFNVNSTGFGLIAAFEKLNANVFLLDADSTEKQVLHIANEFELNAIVDTKNNRTDVNILSTTGESTQDASVTILTSGTTGKPKAVKHTWQSLSAPTRKTNSKGRWLLTYRPQLYAGLQVILQAFVNGAAIAAYENNRPPHEIVSFMADSQVAFVSSTPSFWRRIFLTVATEEISRLDLSQITLGGEIVDQALLSQLKSCFPSTRIIHIYATTELGRCFSVSDGEEGFPASYLKDGPDGVQLKVENDELCVRSKNSMTGYDKLSGVQSNTSNDDWFRTGDLVKVENDRVLFQGRDSDIINVGGNKVNPLLVESEIREVPSVADVRVYGISSSIAGQIVACDVVVKEDCESSEVESQIRTRCIEKLDRFHVPRIIKSVDEIKLNSAGKTKRSDS